LSWAAKLFYSKYLSICQVLNFSFKGIYFCSYIKNNKYHLAISFETLFYAHNAKPQAGQPGAGGYI